MPNKINKLACRVCGKIQDELPGGNDDQCPTYDICDCCGVEFGYGDCTLKAIRISRENWLTKGASWKYPEGKPTNWSFEEQMKNLPEKYL